MAQKFQVPLDRRAFEEHFNLVWAGHDWPADAVLTITKPDKKTSEHVSIHDFEAVWAAIERAGGIGKVWIGVAPRSLERMRARAAENGAWNAENAEVIAADPKKKRQANLAYIRGNGDECYPMPTFFVDLDVNEADSEHGEHKLDKKPEAEGGKVFPSRAHVDGWLEALPLKPTMKVWTGGGYHAWWAFKELMDLETEKLLLARFKKYWEDVKSATGLHIDTNTVEQVRVGRPAGTPKGKGNPDTFFSLITTDELNPDAKYAPTDFNFLPVIEPRTATKRVRKDDGTFENRPVSARSKAELDDLPGTKLGHYLPVSSILEDVFWWERKGDAFADPERANYNDKTVDAHLYTAHDGAEVVKIYDEGTAHDLNVQAGKSVTSFGLLIANWCGGDSRLAARIAAHYDDRGGDLIDLLQEEPTVEDLRTQFPEPVLEVIVERMPARGVVAGAWWNR
ncbi:hypothetical protein B5P43_15740 [Bacillus sp. SRB_336]|nr:hypothetical protein B5P43_15740 [Bacillus sp. SRB_336]